MSYPTLPGFYASGLASETNQNNQMNREILHDSYHTHGHGRNPDEHRHIQHGSSTNIWDHTQQSMLHTMKPSLYRDDHWQSRQSSLHQYGRQPDGHPPEKVDMRTVPRPPIQYNDSSGRGSHDLAHLAYASGLGSSKSPVQQRQQMAQYTESNNDGSRATAPVPQHGASPGPSSNPQMSHAMRQQSSNSSSSSRQMAFEAATALAAAGQHHYQSSQAQSNIAQSWSTRSAITGQTQGQSRVSTASQTPRQANSTALPTLHDSRRGQDYPAKNNSFNNPQTSQFVTDPNARSVRSLPRLSRESIGSTLQDTSSDLQQQSRPSGESDYQPSPYVNPMQVFNPYHREHEQKKKEAETAKQKSEKTRTQSIKQSTDSQPDTNGLGSRDSGEMRSGPDVNKDRSASENTSQEISLNKSEKELMATELQSMMEKMKMFRSRDPKLFQKLWNEMRSKESTSSNGQLSSSVTTLLAVANEKPSTLSDLASAPLTISSLSKSANKAPQATSGPPANGYRTVIEDNPEGLPDLGRFPAERRIRHSNRSKESSAKPESTPVLQGSEQKMPPIIPMSNADNRWPEPRRRAVAVAALRILKGNSENKDTPVTAQDLYMILEKNPSYLDLCAALESKGLKFKRTVFARDLLRSVPDLNSDQASGPNGAVTVEITGLAVTDTLDKQLESPIEGSTEPNKDHLGRPTKDPLLLQRTKFIQYKPESKAPSSEAIMGTKEAAARKRDFAEIVDLTALGDDENYVMPELKKIKFNSTHHAIRHHEVDDSAVTKSTHTNFPGSITTQNLKATPLRFTPHVMVPELITHPLPNAIMSSRPEIQSHKTQDTPRQVILAQKMDLVEAFQKKYYDPRTVARDVLIASGKHSTERPLNNHLNGLLPTYIDFDSDLSTFDWDAIDPGGPPLLKVEYVDVAAAPPRFKLGIRKSPQKRGQVKGNQTPSQSFGVDPLPPSRSLSTTQRTPSEPHGKTHRQSSADGRSTASLKPSSNLQPSSLHLPGRRQSKILIDLPELVSERSPRSAARSMINNNKHSSMDVDQAPHKRRGRPPGSKNKASSSSQFHRKNINLPVHEREGAELPPQPARPNYRCKWARCQSELHNLDTLRKHIAVRHVPTKDEVQEVGFICWWKRCQFLHKNEDGTIEARHIFASEKDWTAHIQEQHIQPIAFKLGDGPNTNTGKLTSSKFDVSKFLYVPLLGTQTRSLSYTDPQAMTQARTRFLSDEQGRATTPAIHIDGSPHLPYDVLELTGHFPNVRGESREADENAQKAFEKAQRAFMKAHEAKPGDHRRRAEETVRAMTARKMKIGPGIDRGGCTLINEARRATFVQAPGIARIIEAPY